MKQKQIVPRSWELSWVSQQILFSNQFMVFQVLYIWSFLVSFALVFFYHILSYNIDCLSKYHLHQNHDGAPHSRSTLSIYLGLNPEICILTHFASDSYMYTELKSENYCSSLEVFEGSFIAFAVVLPIFSLPKNLLFPRLS